MRIGFIGLGRMGQGMSMRLLGGGHDVLVYNRTAGKAADLEKAGAKAVATIAAACHDRDVNAARNLLVEGLRQLAGRDDRDLRVDARDACPGENRLEQVLAEEARSGHRNQACTRQAAFL